MGTKSNREDLQTTGIHGWKEKHWTGTYWGESFRWLTLTTGCSTPEKVSAGGLQDARDQKAFTNTTDFTECNTYITWQEFLQFTYRKNWRSTIPSNVMHASICTHRHILLYIWYSLYKNKNNNKKPALFSTFTLTHTMTTQMLQNYTRSVLHDDPTSLTQPCRKASHACNMTIIHNSQIIPLLLQTKQFNLCMHARTQNCITRSFIICTLRQV
jgi:hypothetical protein